MEELFIALEKALAGGSLLAALAALAWGMLSIILSPCHLVSIPLVVAFTSNQKTGSAKTGFVFGSLFATGMLITVLCIGLVTAALGRFLGNTGTIGLIGQMVAALVLLVIGLWLSGLVRLPFLDALTGRGVQARRGKLAAFITGLVFGLSAGPCTFAWMAPILAITFASAQTDLANAIWLFGWFAIGHGGVLVLAGVFSGAVEKMLHWNNASERTVKVIKIILGILIFLGGIAIIIDAIEKF